MTTPNTPNESLRDELIKAMYEVLDNHFDGLVGQKYMKVVSNRLVVHLARTLTAHGLKIVPVEPDDIMKLDGWTAAISSEDDLHKAAVLVFKAMLAAAPTYLEDKAND